MPVWALQLFCCKQLNYHSNAEASKVTCHLAPNFEMPCTQVANRLGMCADILYTLASHSTFSCLFLFTHVDAIRSNFQQICTHA